MRARSLASTREARELREAQPRATLASLCAHYVINREYYMGARRYRNSLQTFNSITRHLTRSLRSLVSYRVEHLKRNFISARAHILFSIYHINCGVLQGFPALRKAVTTHVKKYRIFFTCIDIRL